LILVAILSCCACRAQIFSLLLECLDLDASCSSSLASI
jgi:hypothetical protein